MVKHVEEMGRDAVDAVRSKTPGEKRDVPGPSTNPATNLIMADVAMRAGSYIVRGAVEKGFLSGRYGRQTAKQIVENKSLAANLISFGIAKVATRSLPGAVLVGGGMLAKTLFDRSQARRARRKGDRKLAKQAIED